MMDDKSKLIQMDGRCNEGDEEVVGSKLGVPDDEKMNEISPDVKDESTVRISSIDEISSICVTSTKGESPADTVSKSAKEVLVDVTLSLTPISSDNSITDTKVSAKTEESTAKPAQETSPGISSSAGKMCTSEISASEMSAPEATMTLCASKQMDDHEIFTNRNECIAASLDNTIQMEITQQPFDPVGLPEHPRLDDAQGSVQEVKTTEGVKSSEGLRSSDLLGSDEGVESINHVGSVNNQELDSIPKIAECSVLRADAAIMGMKSENQAMEPAAEEAESVVKKAEPAIEKAEPVIHMAAPVVEKAEVILNSDWFVDCSDDEQYSISKADIIELYENVSHNKPMILEWKLMGRRRSPTPTRADSEVSELINAESEEQAVPAADTYVAVAGFDFDEPSSELNRVRQPSRRVSGITPRATQRRVARLDKIMNDIVRHRKLDEGTVGSDVVPTLKTNSSRSTPKRTSRAHSDIKATSGKS